MKPINEQKMAEHLLDAREHHHSISRIIRRSIRVYLIMVGGLLAILALAAAAEQWCLVAFTAGALLSAIGRDFTWLRASKQRWPFYVKTFDWEKIKKSAEGIAIE